jgi:anthranilate/para-aminobenzoate synthase component I
MSADAWASFVNEARDSPVAGYFELGSALGEPSPWAAWYSDADDVWRIPRGATVSELESSTRARLTQRGVDALVGYLGFDAVGMFEPLLRHVPAHGPFPLGEFAVVRRLRRARLPPARRLGIEGQRRRSRRSPQPESATLSEAGYRASVSRLRRDIYRGEAYQVVLSNRRAWPRPGNLIERAGRLRERERYAYFYYLRFDDREIVGASPESVVEIRRERATVSPIAGTRPADAAGARRRSLSTDPKELAEHRMLVDLARNDLGRVCTTGSVRVVERERVERFSRLEHLISRVAGRIRPHVSGWDVLGSTFPAGTVSGAPKIRATQLLRREERSWRGPYAGAVGLLTPDGDARWALAIRTAFATGSRLYTAAGAGIVWPSRPQREYRETLAKLAQVEASLVGPEDGRP